MRGATAVFTAAAIGTPEPQVRWQRSDPGSDTFADVPGATAAELRLEATAADTGARFRAVFANAAGALATESATLTVVTTTPTPTPTTTSTPTPTSMPSATPTPAPSGTAAASPPTDGTVAGAGTAAGHRPVRRHAGGRRRGVAAGRAG